MDKKRAYAYLRVSTTVQVEGKSLEGQLKEIEKYCGAYGIELVSVYSDEGKSGKWVHGRLEFQRMLKDIEEKHEVDYVIVWKLSRFGRNARESLNSLNFMQKHGVNLIAQQEGLNSSGAFGNFMFTILAALAEMERENIIEQTYNGKKYNAYEGNWSGGQAPYGYDLIDKKLVVNPEEAEIVKFIFETYISNERIGYGGITALLNKANIRPKRREKLDRKAMIASGTDEKIYMPVAEDWYTDYTRLILDNPVYMGKIQFGRYKVTVEDGKSKRVINEDAPMIDGKHEAIISEEMWYKAHEKRKRTGVKFGRPDSKKADVHNMFNQIARCPQCGSRMVSCQSQYKKADGTVVRYYQYICSYYNNHKHGKCRKNMIRADFLEGTVMDAVEEYVKRPNVMESIVKHMGAQLDTSNLETEQRELEEELKRLDKREEVQYNILGQIGEGKYKNMKPEKIMANIEKIGEDREDIGIRLENVKNELEAVQLNKLSYEMIKSLLENFTKACMVASKEQKRLLVRSLIKEIKLGYRECDNKVIPVSMTFKFSDEQVDLLRENSGVLGLNEEKAEVVIQMTFCGGKQK